MITQCIIGNNLPNISSTFGILNDIADQIDSALNTYYDQRFFYSALMQDHHLLDSLDGNAYKLWSELQTDNVGLEEKLYEGLHQDFKEAYKLLNDFDYTESYAEMIKNVVTIWVNTWALGESKLTQPELDALDEISKKSPSFGRDAVASACVMLGNDLPESQEGQNILPQLNKLQGSFGNIYPNPTNETATLQYYLPNGTAELRIIDLTGRLISNYNLFSNEILFTFDVRNLSEGVYFINVTQNGNILFSSKFAVIKK